MYVWKGIHSSANSKVFQVSRNKPLGPETEAFFNQAEELLQQQPPGAPMVVDNSPLCDFDGDQDCDESDFQFFQKAFGKCEMDDGYHPAADEDGSGCVDLVDQHYLFPTNNPPVALCQNITTYADAGCKASVSVDNGSYDPDGDSITLTQSPPAPYGLGTTNVTLTVTDDKATSISCSAAITVVDVTPPTITNITATPTFLWPPNHKLAPVRLDVSAQDNCELQPACKVISITSNEPEDDKTDGKTSPDWIVTGDLTADLRAERSGIGEGRVYTITVGCADVSTNRATGSINVSVVHDKGK